MRVKLPGYNAAALTSKLARLLDMEYTPAEIEDETGISQKVLYRLFSEKDMPARKGANNRLWIHGLTFAAWVRGDDIPKAKKIKMAPDEFFCVSCRVVVVPLPETVTEKIADTYSLKSARCPSCGRKTSKVSRIIKR